MKKFLITSLIMGSNLVYALPTIEIPNLVYAPNVTTINLNNVDIRGNINQSGKFKVIESKHKINFSNLKAESNLSPAIESINSIQDNSNYLLVGQVIAVDSYNNYYDVPNSDKTTGTKSLNATVSYKLIRTQDNAIISSFTIAAQAQDTGILSPGQVLHMSQAQLINDLSKDLAQKVTQQLIGQYANNLNNSLLAPKDTPLVTGVTIYND
ncbi:MAG: hypothetical protein RLZZ293_170 [Pseudomonadota bacterium]|jgi:hypothetical protein